ncbi:MAG: hypothetical protein R3C10_19780 [Pirellulales bacterium]
MAARIQSDVPRGDDHGALVFVLLFRPRLRASTDVRTVHDPAAVAKVRRLTLALWVATLLALTAFLSAVVSHVAVAAAVARRLDVDALFSTLVLTGNAAAEPQVPVILVPLCQRRRRSPLCRPHRVAQTPRRRTAVATNLAAAVGNLAGGVGRLDHHFAPP